jgi:hypothetical protein
MKKQLATIYLSNTWVKSSDYLDLIKVINGLSIRDLKISIVNKFNTDDIHSLNLNKIKDEIAKARIILFPVGLYSDFSTLIDFENNTAMNHSLAQLSISKILPTKKDKEKFHNAIDISCTFEPESLIGALYEGMDLYSEYFED